MEPIGEQLIAAGLIEPVQLEWALAQQRAAGGFLGQHLIAAGFVTRADFYAVLSESWQADRRDLVAQPPQAELLAELDVEQAVELGWTACELTDDGGVVVASAVLPTEDLVVEVSEVFPGRRIEFVPCTQDDLDSVALGVRVERLAGARGTTPARLVRPFHVVLAVVGAPLAAAGAAVLPLDALAVLLLAGSAVFLVGGVLQVLTGYFLLVEAEPSRPTGRSGPSDRPPSRAPEIAEGDDVDLPLYSVIVRVGGGRAGLDELFDNFRSVDYPRDRTDAILVVSRDDAETVAALRATSPRGWARVALVPEADFVDVVRACDHGLALARGRYVVAYDQDERPAADQLRRAVAVFEAELAARLASRRPAPPLVGLRVAQRGGTHPPGLRRIAAADEVLGIAGPSGHGAVARSAAVTGVHFNMRLLRRAGGFGLLLSRPFGDGGPRIETLESSSDRTSPLLARRWWDQQADAFTQDVLDVAARTAVLLRRNAQRPAEEATAVAVRVAVVSLLLTYPVVLGGGLTAAVRSAGTDGSLAANAAWVALGEVGLVVGAVTGAAAVLLARRRGWRAGIDALALPVLWLLYSFAAWAALYAVLLRGRDTGRR
ncbi:MAG TPA: hypothetical protein VNS46_04840 [Nocardioides sp.]|nr:hypothetical protein [Nocardioides sp.]